MSNRELEQLFSDFMDGGPPWANEFSKVQAQALIDYFRPKLLAWRDKAVVAELERFVDDFQKKRDWAKAELMPETPIEYVDRYFKERLDQLTNGAKDEQA